jgi:hypothetical protein
VGLVNVMVTPRRYDRYRTDIRTSPFLRVHGIIDHHAGDVAMVKASSIYPIRPKYGPLITPDGKSWG